MANGHSAARYYPLGYLWNEARFVRQRENNRLATEAVLMTAVIAQVLTGKGPLNDKLKELQDGH